MTRWPPLGGACKQRYTAKTGVDLTMWFTPRRIGPSLHRTVTASDDHCIGRSLSRLDNKVAPQAVTPKQGTSRHWITTHKVTADRAIGSTGAPMWVVAISGPRDFCSGPQPKAPGVRRRDGVRVSAVLIDLRARPVWSANDSADFELLAVQAQARGLDGLAVLGDDRAIVPPDLAELSAATGVRFFVGVELACDDGPLLCFPQQAQGWFAEQGWRALGDAPYRAEAVVQAFAEQGGAVVAVPVAGDAEWRAVRGAVAVLALGGAEHCLDEAALRTAQVARLACVGGSGATPADAWFGSVATVFATPPADQAALVDGLRAGRAWPAEIGFTPPAPRRAATPAAEAISEPDMRAQTNEPRQERQPRERSREVAPKEAVAVRGAKTKRPATRFDPQERPGDNRGNRMNRDELLQALCMPANAEDIQPTHDPVAIIYGIDSRRQQRHRDRNDLDLDRLVNGNRAKGPDPNIMAMPMFEELRNDRQPISTLFAQSEERHDLEDSIALRFALSHVRREEDGTLTLQGNPLDRGRMSQRGRPQRRRR